MEAYLDNSATTRVDVQVQELMKKLMDVDFGNPSSRHQKGVVAEGYIKEARQKIAATLKVDPKELIITSGGTESNNMALIGTALAAKRKGKHIITTAVEHPSVKATASFLEEQGFRITFLSVDSRGQISLEDLKEALTPDTILVSIMYVNNEIGTIQPVEEAAKLVHATVPGAVFHVDAIQAYGKVMIRPKQQGIDLLSVSSHKFHGPKGAGFLYCSSKVNLHPIIFGGGQQSGMRSGTENVPGAAGMGLAAQLAYQNFEQKKAHLNELRRYFLEGIHKLDDVSINGWDETADGALPHLPPPECPPLSGCRGRPPARLPGAWLPPAAARRIFPAMPGWPRPRRPGPRSTAPPVQGRCPPAFPAAAAYLAQCSSARPPLQE